jgi:hypothetical protein
MNNIMPEAPSYWSEISTGSPSAVIEVKPGDPLPIQYCIAGTNKITYGKCDTVYWFTFFVPAENHILTKQQIADGVKDFISW